MKNKVRCALRAGTGMLLVLALCFAVPAFGWPPSAWRVTAVSGGVIADPATHCHGEGDPIACCTGNGTGPTCINFPKTYDLDPGRSGLLSYQFNYTCTTCDGSNKVTVTLECTIDEVKWRTLDTLVSAASTNQDIGPLTIRMDDPDADVTTNDVLCYKYRLSFAATGAPEITAVNVSYFRRTGTGL